MECPAVEKEVVGMNLIKKLLDECIGYLFLGKETANGFLWRL